MISKSLVTYFSAWGTGKSVAEEIARQTGAKIQEIIPKKPYDPNRDH